LSNSVSLFFHYQKKRMMMMGMMVELLVSGISAEREEE
jgi:hypothetical protein